MARANIRLPHAPAAARASLRRGRPLSAKLAALPPPGLASSMRHNEPGAASESSGPAGTMLYTPPELFGEQPAPAASAAWDVFSLGVVLVESLHRAFGTVGHATPRPAPRPQHRATRRDGARRTLRTPLLGARPRAAGRRQQRRGSPFAPASRLQET